MFEENLKRRDRRGKIQEAVLASVAFGGLLAVAVIAPNVLGVLKKINPELFKKSSMTSVGRTTQALEKRGFLKSQGVGKDRRLSITASGQKFLDRIRFEDAKIEKPKRWDKKWRMVIFDLKEERRKTRTYIRHTLKSIGFYRLQDSVWVHPYPCEEIIALLKAETRTGKEVLYIIADTIEYDAPLKRHFNLVGN